MKSSLSLSLLVTFILSQLVLAQQEENANMPEPVTDIYWWRSLLSEDQLKNYLTGPVNDDATETVTNIVTDVLDKNDIMDDATATITEANTDEAITTTTEGTSTNTVTGTASVSGSVTNTRATGSATGSSFSASNGRPSTSSGETASFTLTSRFATSSSTLESS
ncbi:uncharacterized protein BX663DRAFT_228207 [Cokeromyces recurvatus]|uniref:uncharacterized protein n=1 Tax=Cokeromyces recurvatus TaxID=90255 RepID=UPI00221E8846|nr:uncharacterized protein BX663DRAFT_228207 [Cokeromyces recurvatus]KAI7898903.1 hypothetical protein BX663DRAFT_228207 [Cokeromyces recurvatus]